MDARTNHWMPALAGLFFLLALLGGVVLAEPGPAPAPAPADGDRYVVESVALEFDRATPGLPSIDDLMEVEVELGVTDSGYVAPRADLPTVRLRLQDVSSLDQRQFHATAIRAISQAVVDELNRRGYVDVHVSPVLGQFGPSGRDLRPVNALDLRLAMRLGQVTDVVTTSSGERFDDEQSNMEAHRRILRNSPIGPVSGQESAERVDVLRKDLLDDYLYLLNRHPGRRVDATLAPGATGKGVTVEYTVTENKPWISYAQVSNTGTDSTDSWRQRLGYVNNQLTSHDDIFTLDYITSSFDEVNAGSVSYEAPFPDSYRTRWRVNGFYSEFTSSDLGIFGSDFSGEDMSIGADVYHNFYQRRQLFVDAFVGASWRDISAENVGIGGDGDDSYFLPHLGVRLERVTDYSTTTGSLSMEFNLSDVAGSDSNDSALLGRADPDVDWQVVRFNVSHSFYLEPVLFRTSFEDPSTPGSSTMAHEVVGSFRMQNSLGNRLIPHMEQTVGGLYTVRGYEESLVAGDDVMMASLEYRFHIPRTLAPRPYEGRKVFGRDFRLARESVYGRPDWDLVAKAFVDVGRTGISDATLAEGDYTLIGTGVGVDLVVWRNLSVRTDWGFALKDVDDRVESGDNEFHVVATILF